MSKKVLITQSNYIPWKGYFDTIHTVDEFIIYDDMQFTRRDWRNRNKIKTPQGVQWLTIPAEVKGKYLQKIRDTKISDKSWAAQHWKTISHNYSKAASFATHKSFIEELYTTCTYEYLSEINFHFIKGICAWLGMQTSFRWSGEFNLAEGKTERLVDLCKQTGATDYYTGPAAKNYMDEKLFEEENIKIHYMDYSGYPPYRQLFGDFVHEVSIIDLILNEGDNSKKFLKSFSANEALSNH